MDVLLIELIALLALVGVGVAGKQAGARAARVSEE